MSRQRVRRKVLIADMDTNPPSTLFLKSLSAVLNSLVTEMSYCCQTKSLEMNVGIVLPYEFFPHKIESRWFEHCSDLPIIENQCDDIDSLLCLPKCSSLATQLEQLFSMVGFFLDFVYKIFLCKQLVCRI